MSLARRKLAVATWRSPREGNIYGKITVDAGPVLAWLEAQRERHPQLTLTHVVLAAAGRSLAQATGLNGHLRWGRFHPHARADAALLLGDRRLKLEGLDQLSVLQIERQLSTQLAAEDRSFEHRAERALPAFLLRPVLRLAGWLTGTLGRRFLGLEAFPFGACAITPLPGLGLDEAWAPPIGWAPVAVQLVFGDVVERPALVDGQVVPRQELTLFATVDHRFIDGFEGADLARFVRELLEHPATI